MARLLRAEDTRRDEPALLDSLLLDGTPMLRSRAALAAGRIGAVRHRVRIRSLTADADTSVAATAWFALMLLHDSASAPSAGAAIHAAPPVAREAARLLGSIGDSGRAAIVAGLADSTLDSSVRGSLLLNAARLRPLPVDAVLPLVASRDTALAWRAAYALARSRSAAGARSLLAVADAPNEALREQVVRGLSKGIAGDSLGERAFDALQRMAGDPIARVRVNAVRSLASYGPRARAGLLAALHDNDAGVRVTAAQSLSAALDSADTAWIRALAADTSLVYESAVLEAAATKGVMLPAIDSWRTSSDWRRRAVAVGVDRRGTAAAAIGRISAWIGDRDPRVRAAAAEALGMLAESTTVRDSARTVLRRALRDDDPFVRAAALDGLTKGASMLDLTVALREFRRSARDRDADARLAFWALADTVQRRAGDSLSGSALRELRALGRPGDPLERAVAAHIQGLSAWADSTGTPHPLAWYEARAREASYHPTRHAYVETQRGVLELVLRAEDAPLTVYNFVTLARRGYFDGQRFHRVVPNFVVQAGDPRGDGNGGPGYAIRDELNRRTYDRGTLGMALSGPNTGGSQFFITHSPQPHLDGGYTVFGQLRSGFDVLDRIVQGDRILRVRID
jgi:cyclophilin family peptidyl-prolyl cis-trans isomerase/HEAT repeat protein